MSLGVSVMNVFQNAPVGLRASAGLQRHHVNQPLSLQVMQLFFHGAADKVK